MPVALFGKFACTSYAYIKKEKQTRTGHWETCDTAQNAPSMSATPLGAALLETLEVSATVTEFQKVSYIFEQLTQRN